MPQERGSKSVSFARSSKGTEGAEGAAELLGGTYFKRPQRHAQVEIILYLWAAWQELTRKGRVMLFVIACLSSAGEDSRVKTMKITPSESRERVSVAVNIMAGSLSSLVRAPRRGMKGRPWPAAAAAKRWR